MKNKYQIALDNIVLDINEGVIYSTDLERFMKDLKILQELVDKATPKKLVKNITFRGGFVRRVMVCPNCDVVHYEETDYCPNCGQKIDWSDKDE